MLDFFDFFLVFQSSRFIVSTSLRPGSGGPESRERRGGSFLERRSFFLAGPLHVDLNICTLLTQSEVLNAATR